MTGLRRSAELSGRSRRGGCAHQRGRVREAVTNADGPVVRAEVTAGTRRGGGWRRGVGGRQGARQPSPHGTPLYRDLAEGRGTHKCAPVAFQELVGGFWFGVAVAARFVLVDVAPMVKVPLYFRSRVGTGPGSTSFACNQRGRCA